MHWELIIYQLAGDDGGDTSRIYETKAIDDKQGHCLSKKSELGKLQQNKTEDWHHEHGTNILIGDAYLVDSKLHQ